MASYGQPYGATSPLMQHASPSPFPTTTPQQAANIQPGSITYTTTVGNDGQVVYHPFKAVAASYQTPQGVVNGIQWIPAEATSVVPSNATPAGADLAASFGRNPDARSYGARDDDYRRKNDLSRGSIYDRGDRRDRDPRDRYDDERDRDDDYYRRPVDRERERDRAERERDRAERERDRRGSTYGGAPVVGGAYGQYDKYDTATAELERRMRDVDLDRRERERDYERDRDRTARSRRNSVYGGADRPTSTYQPAAGGAYGAAPYGSSAPYTAAAGGAYPTSAAYHPPSPRPGDILPRAASPYRVGGALPRPSSPYQVPIAPRPVSPYQSGGIPRAASPFQAASIQRAASPYGGGGIQRAASPYGSGGGIQRAASPYGPGGGIQRAASPYGNAMRPGASPYGGAAPLPGGGSSGVYPPGHVLEGQPLRSHSRAPSPSPYGQPGGPVNIYSNPQTSSIYGSAQPGAYGASSGAYGASSGAYGGGYGGGGGIAAHASPRMGGGAGMPIPPQEQAAMLTVPEGFARPPNRAQPYTHFEIMKIQDMDDFLDVIPRMPAVLVPHDVYHEDWIRLMQDLAMAWAGTLPVPQYSADGRAPKRSTLAADVIDLWNASFFRARGVEMVLYKGRERRSGRMAGTVDMQLPGFDEYDVSSPSESSDGDDSAEERLRDRDRYGAAGAYGRQAEAELREARRARRERKADRKKRKMEKKVRKRAKELDRTYAVFLHAVQPEVM
ncbi:uncharacterized protein TRAVEDRAFT_70135 [Trametes versicolor FP-101664 SS1]|uniref:uncharacterized protein n=1 Tax=Trametes versicolor (strain FP-101664) TaxID=717944 RepID=UPI0004622BC5|nr:uncharacterized protein TRAVEDRAFT_70135 [Trametes versicolor FP-101664 SS1]EIW61893.1 hypothetical protein TRAVEDRAFT_70135 [Trametes versicolor FP-101664 SS1]